MAKSCHGKSEQNFEFSFVGRCFLLSHFAKKTTPWINRKMVSLIISLVYTNLPLKLFVMMVIFRAPGLRMYFLGSFMKKVVSFPIQGFNLESKKIINVQMETPLFTTHRAVRSKLNPNNLSFAVRRGP